ncbi:3-oxoacyl-[acyl-carrier-protein] reductase [Monosporozyma servazzii]
MERILPVAIITGSTGHIGREVVKKLSQEGFSCICLGSKPTPKVDLPLQFQTGTQRHQYMSLDMSQALTSEVTKLQIPGISYEEGVTRQSPLSLFQYLFWNSELGQYKLQLLVNIAGVSQNRLSVKMAPEEIAKMVNINMLNPMILSQVVTKQMYRESHRGVERNHRPCIVNISSILSEVDIRATSIYSATKAGLTRYSQLFGNELSPYAHWPRIKALQPGPVIDSGMVQELSAASKELLIQQGKTSQSLTTTQEVALNVWQAYLSD